MRPEQIVEATLFASEAPLTLEEIARADESLSPERVKEAIRTLRSEYEQSERAFQLYQLGDGYQVLTRPEFASYLERFDSVPRSPTLSGAALETLAIVAYRQPIGRAEIEEIRGVGSSTVLRTLQDWELIEVVDRGEGLGRPLLYGTTERFLEHFGFQSMDDLPVPEDLPVTLHQDRAEPGDEPREEGGGREPASAGAPSGEGPAGDAVADDTPGGNAAATE